MRIGRDDGNTKHTVCSKTTTNHEAITTTTKITIDLSPSPTETGTKYEFPTRDTSTSFNRSLIYTSKTGNKYMPKFENEYTTKPESNHKSKPENHYSYKLKPENHYLLNNYSSNSESPNESNLESTYKSINNLDQSKSFEFSSLVKNTYSPKNNQSIKPESITDKSRNCDTKETEFTRDYEPSKEKLSQFRENNESYELLRNKSYPPSKPVRNSNENYNLDLFSDSKSQIIKSQIFNAQNSPSEFRVDDNKCLANYGKIDDTSSGDYQNSFNSQEYYPTKIDSKLSKINSYKFSKSDSCQATKTDVYVTSKCDSISTKTNSSKTPKLDPYMKNPDSSKPESYKPSKSYSYKSSKTNHCISSKPGSYKSAAPDSIKSSKQDLFKSSKSAFSRSQQTNKNKSVLNTDLNEINSLPVKNNSFKSTSLILNTIKTEDDEYVRKDSLAEIPKQLEALRKLYEDNSDSEADKEVQVLMSRLEDTRKLDEDISSVVSGSWSKMRAFKNINQQLHKIVSKNNDMRLGLSLHAHAEKGISWVIRRIKFKGKKNKS